MNDQVEQWAREALEEAEDIGMEVERTISIDKPLMQPVQPLLFDAHGVLRFKRNDLVRYILDKGGINLNDLAIIDFPIEDRIQFAQLIGYSVSGFGTLSYVTDEAYDRVNKIAQVVIEKREQDRKKTEKV